MKSAIIGILQKENTSWCCSWKSSNNKLFFFCHMSKIFPLIEIIAVPLLSVGNAAYRFSTNDLWQFCIIRKNPKNPMIPYEKALGDCGRNKTFNARKSTVKSRWGRVAVCCYWLRNRERYTKLQKYNNTWQVTSIAADQEYAAPWPRHTCRMVQGERTKHKVKEYEYIKLMTCSSGI